MFSKLSISLAAALAISAGSPARAVGRANHIPTSTDEARALTAKVRTTQPRVATAPVNSLPSSTDEARALAGSLPPVSSAAPNRPTIVSSTDEARAAVGPANRAAIPKSPLAGSPGVADEAVFRD